MTILDTAIEAALIRDPNYLVTQANITAKVNLANTLIDLAADDELTVAKLNTAATAVRSFMQTPNGTTTVAANQARDQVIKILIRAVFYIIRKYVLPDGR